MKLVVAVSPNNLIGTSDGKLLYHDSEEMDLFKKWTNGVLSWLVEKPQILLKKGY